MMILYIKALVSLLIISFIIAIAAAIANKYKFNNKVINTKEKKIKLEDLLIIDNQNKVALIKYNKQSYLLLINNGSIIIDSFPKYLEDKKQT